MNILENQSAEVISLGETSLSEMKKIIELAGRTCYKSLNKISEGSSEKFVNRMIANKHTAMLEHGTIYLKIPKEGMEIAEQFLYFKNVAKYSSTSTDKEYVYVTTNYRVIIENDLEEALKYQCEYEEGHHERRMTVRLTTNLQILAEFTRHRTLSFAVESSRYCNYSKDKFSNELAFIRPNFGIFSSNSEVMKEWEKDMERAEYAYLKLCAMGAKPQEAAQTLPKAVKCEMVMSGTKSEWKHFFDLRYRETTGPAHPQAKEAATLIHKEFEKKGIIL